MSVPVILPKSGARVTVPVPRWSRRCGSRSSVGLSTFATPRRVDWTTTRQAGSRRRSSSDGRMGTRGIHTKLSIPSGQNLLGATTRNAHSPIMEDLDGVRLHPTDPQHLILIRIIHIEET